METETIIVGYSAEDLQKIKILTDNCQKALDELNEGIKNLKPNVFSPQVQEDNLQKE